MVDFISSFNDGPVTPVVLTNPGDYKVLDFTLEGENGTISIPEKLLGFTVYENLSNPYLTAEFLIVDTQNLPSTFPIEGGEKVEVLTRDCLGNDRTLKFRVTKITDRAPTSPSSITYTIHGTSEHVIRSHSNSISRAIINQQAENEIDAILKELYFPNELKSSATAQEICGIIPNWRPLKSISWLTKRSFSDVFENSPYVTFMTINGEMFHVPVDLLYKTPARQTYRWLANKSSVDGNLSLTNDTRMTRHLYSFLDFKVMKTSSTLENLSSGMFKTRVQMIDLFERKEEDSLYDYAESFDDTEHLGSKPISIFDAEVGADSMWTTVFRHNGLFSQESEQSRYETKIAAHNSKKQQMKNFVIHGRVPGHFDLNVGQKYDVRIPGFSNSLDFQQSDEYLSGNYVIDAIKHDFFPNSQYVATIQAFKDSVG